MAEERTQRRLAAIIAADVVGYSKLMGQDEEGTLSRLKKLRAEFLHPKVDQYSGRIVKTTGDGTLIEFGSAVDAVSHAVDVQRGLAERNAKLPESKQIHFRIGINVGDIIIDEDDIYGDGVNIAARLEAIADPDGICISSRVYDHVSNRTDVSFEDIGEHNLKNISETQRIFKVQFLEPTSISKLAKSRIDTVIDKPSIAVLPFDNLSGAAEQNYFSEGISEDLITALSRFRMLSVIARNLSFAHASEVSDMVVLGRKLGVRYLLEGSVRKAGNRVRITAQLIETNNGNQVWAHRYDRDLTDIFDIQDEITRRIAIAIEPEITLAEIERSKTFRTNNISAWDYYLRALPHFHKVTKEDNNLAVTELGNAIELDEGYVPAIALLALCHVYSVLHSWSRSRSETIKKAGELAEQAISIDPTDPAANLALSWYCLYDNQLERGLTAARNAAEQEPNSFIAWCQVGSLLAHLCRADEAYVVLKSVEKSSIRDPWRWWWYMNWGNAYFAGGQYEDAVKILNKGKELRPSWYGFYVILAASAANSGQYKIAKEAADTLLKVLPRATMRGFRRHPTFAKQSVIDALLTGLEKAGIPEQ